MICGIDEAGRGPVIGPMVVAGVWIEEEDEEKLLGAGVKDSKKLTPSKREKIASYIRDNFVHEIVVIEARDIDDLRKTLTINELEAYVFAKVANKNFAKVYFIDSAGNDSKEFGEMFKKNLKYDCEIVCEHKADEKYAVCSAASIVAKVERDRQIKKISEELEKVLNKPLGSGYPSDEKTIEFIREWFNRFNKFPPYTRKSWKTLEKIKQKKLEV
ncbi:MAG: ribonuclease HII [Thermoplasmatales archaeon]|nr:ribonuclease HII [Thermoplasmatales archaeon]